MKKINEHLFKGLILMAFLLLNSIGPLSAQHDSQDLQIECIMVGQTDIWDIGKACEISLNRFENWVEDIEKMTGIPANITRIEGENYTKEFIANYLNNLSFEKPENTIVIFYGTGHGFNYRENVLKYPVFAAHPTRKEFNEEEFNEFRLSLQKDIHEVLLNKGARFVTTFGELCNNLEDIEVPDIYRPMAPCASSVQELFMETEGDIIAASSQRDQLSYTSGIKGGVFLGEFLRSFYSAVDDCDSKPDWGSIMDNSLRLTEQVNGQIPIYDVGYIDSPVNLVEADNQPKKRVKKNKSKSSLDFPKKEKFDGNTIVAPRIIHIKN